MTEKEIIGAAAAATGIPAFGIAPLAENDTLRKQLAAAGPVPFAPEDIGRRLHADSLLPGAKSAVVCLFPYKPKEPEEGNIALYARPVDYHRIDHAYLARLAAALRAHFPEADFAAACDTSPLVDRFLAYSAGLGFYGKNHCLIHPVYGSLFTVGALLTTLALPSDAPLESRCGDCRRCLAACPGRSLSEMRMDPYRCRSYLTQKKDPLTDEETAILRRTPYIFGCDECQRCCPWNENASPSPLPEISERRVPFLTKEMLDALSNRAFEREYKEYAFAWRGRKILLRNAELIKNTEK